MPVWITLSHDGADVEASTKRLSPPGTSEQEFYVEFKEVIGESIARNICDAGVLAFCAIAESCMLPTPTDIEPSGLKVLKNLFTGQKPINALDIGCGVGILGGGLSVVFPRIRPPPSRRCTILMTDLEEAKSRTRSNMSWLLKAQQEYKPNTAPPVKLPHENPDWEQGREGVFGPEAQSRRWDFVLLSDCTYNVDMLPALLGTLSALHESNTAETGEQPQSTKVFLATKPRHVSEEALFGLLSDQGWTELHRQTLPLPVLGDAMCGTVSLRKGVITNTEANAVGDLAVPPLSRYTSGYNVSWLDGIANLHFLHYSLLEDWLRFLASVFYVSL